MCAVHGHTQDQQQIENEVKAYNFYPAGSTTKRLRALANDADDYIKLAGTIKTIENFV